MCIRRIGMGLFRIEDIRIDLVDLLLNSGEALAKKPNAIGLKSAALQIFQRNFSRFGGAFQMRDVAGQAIGNV